ncbi:MAG: RNA 2',3'-cyclic phosphodiesterase [Euryarchaeota archaeon]|nr:RNA 2',3'-cyclic phosphodiesterase [Euryarchaeota archaeon]
MRAFVGIPLPPPGPVERLLDELRESGADLKVVAARNLHATVKFLGDIADAQAPIILERLRAARLPRDYAVALEDVGAFPDWKRFNVLWVGMKDRDGELAKTFVQAEKAFAEIGFIPETRPFSPHATIARKRSDSGKEGAKEVLSRHRNEAFGDVQVRGPVLYRSTLTPTGPVYEVVGEAFA